MTGPASDPLHEGRGRPGDPWPDDRPWSRSGGRRGWGRGGPRHIGGFIGCALIGTVLFIALLTILASWVAATVLGVVAPGTGASAPTAFAVVLVILVAIAVVAMTLGRAVRPLARIAAATERLGDGEAGVRVEVEGPGAVRRLAASFNAMAERLDRSREDRQALLADVTHELRTPLQVIAGSTEAMLDGVHPRDEAHLAPILAETEVMNRLLDDLRTLSLAEAGALPLHREETDLRRLAADVAASHRAAALSAGVDLAADDGPSLLAEVDPVRVREVVANLVTNALRHTPAGGSVRIAVRADGAWAEIAVTDTGEGIDPAALDRVFDRFERRADSGGSGLGLAIARDLVAAHGGTIAAESDGIPGHGTTFRVRLPRGG